MEIKMKLVFILTVWLVQVSGNSESSNSSQTDMREVYDRISEEMLMAFSRSQDLPQTRYKRGLQSAQQSLIDDSGVDRLVSIRGVAKLCHPAIRTLFIDVGIDTYAACLTESFVHVGHYQNHSWTSDYSRLVFSPVDMAAFHYNSYLYVIVTEGEVEHTNLWKINLKTGDASTDHLTSSNYPTSIAIWKMEINGQYVYQMATVNSVKRDVGDLARKITIYKWFETYFDIQVNLPVYDVKDIEPFRIHTFDYIAVANFRRSALISQVDSEIFRFDLQDNTWVSHQKIRTYNAMDWKFFTLGTSVGKEFFLAVANNDGSPGTRSMIYKFVEDKFLPFQCLQTERATSISTFSQDSTFLLAVANELDAVHLYQYDGWRFVPSIQSTEGAMSAGVVHIDFYRLQNLGNSIILSVSNPKSSAYMMSVFIMGFRRENILEDWHSKSTNWCLKVLTKLEKSDIDRSIGNFKDVIFTDQSSITIDGDLVFENGFEADTLRTPELTEISTGMKYDDNLLVNLSKLQARLQAVKEKLDKFGSILQNALKIDGNQNITGHLEFKDAIFDCKSYGCHFTNVYTNVLNRENILNWSNNLVFLDNEQFIGGTLYADKISAGSVDVHGLVDYVDSRNLVTKSGSHNITRHKSFKNSISAHDVQVSGKVDGVFLSYANVLLKTGHQRVNGSISFDELETTWLNAKSVNGRDFTKFYHDLVFTEGTFTITGEKSFGDLTVNELSMNPGSKINGVDLVDLWKNTLWKKGNQNIKAEITFSDALIQKNLAVSQGINGIQIPGPRIVDITEPALITASYTFQSSTKISQFHILNSLNGKSLVPAPDGSMQLDIMLKSGNQIVTGVKTFQTIHLDADSVVHGTVDGIKLSEFRDSVLRKNSSIVTNGTWVFNNLVIKGPLSVKGKISGIDLNDVYTRALKLDDAEVPDMSFKKFIEIDDLESNDINDINVREDLVLVNEPQFIYGNKIFDRIILEENSMVHGLVNNFNLSMFNEVIFWIGNQAITSKVFKKNVRVKDLTVTGSINGVPVTDILTLKGGKIFGSRVLKNVTFTDIEAKNIEVIGNVNGINLKEMMEDTMTYDGFQTVYGKKEFTGTIFVMNNTNLVTSDLNGVDFAQLLSDAVLIGVPQQITGKKIFEDNVAFGNLYFDETLDGVSEWDMRFNWMLKNTPQTVESNVKFENGFSTEDLIVNKINDININNLKSEIVKLDETIEVEGPVIFENSVVSIGGISLTGKIQGVDLSAEAVQRDNIIVTGEKKFLKDLLIDGDLTADGTIDGIYVEDLCNKAILGNKENVSLTIKGDVIFMEGGIIGGNIAGVDLKQLEDIVVQNDETPIKFSGLKTFSNVTFEGPVTVKGNLGDTNLNYLLENYMSLTKKEEMSSNISFEEVSFKGALFTDKFDTHNKEINHVNVEHLNARILKTTGTQTIGATYHIDEVIFDGDVFVIGKVNGCELPSGLMRRNHINYVQSPKIFEKPVIVTGNLEMEEGKKIQGVDVSDWYQKAVLKEGKFEIRGHKVFNSLYLNDIGVEGLLDGLKISENSLLMTYGNQVVTGRKVIVGSVIVEGSLNVGGLINEVDLWQLSRETLQRDRNNNVTGMKYFSQPLTILSLQAPTVAGVDVIKLRDELNTSLNFDFLENQLSEIEGLISHMQIAFNNQAVLFQYYELYDEFDVPAAYDWLYVSGKDCGELLFLSDNSSSVKSCSSLRIFGFDDGNNRFIPSRQEIKTSYAISVKSLTFLNATYIFVANRNPHSECSSESYIGISTTDIYAWDGHSFTKKQSLPVHKVADIAVFKDGNLACLVMLEYNNSTVHCASESNHNFIIKEVLFTTGGQQARVIKSLGRILLAVVAEDISHQYMDGEKYIEIYFWDSHKAAFSTRKQVIQMAFVQSIVMMNYKLRNSEELFLVVAEGSIPKIHNKPRIIIYRHEHDSFEKYQEIEDYGILDWLSLNTGELLFFALDSLRGLIKVYQYKGSSGFVKIDTIKCLGTTSVHAFVRPLPEDSYNHYIALAGPRADMAKPTQGVDYAKILKSKVKGKYQFY